jgi:hypothetical protein
MIHPTAYDHEAILDTAELGNSPSDEYLQRVDMLDNVVRECMYISRGYAGIPSPTSRHFYASVLFTALITRGVSLAVLMPHTPWAQKRIEHWDYATAAGVVRTMLELRIAFFYLCAESCSEDEWQCRWNIFNLHDCVSRHRLFEAKGDTSQVQAFTEQAAELRDRIESNIYFQSLAISQQRKFLHGQTAYLSSLEDIAERAGVEKSNFRWLYILFSSHVHGLPMSFYRIGEGAQERGRGLPSPVEERYTSLCLSLASTFLVKTRDEVHELFLKYKEQAEEKIRQEIALNAKEEDLQNIVANEKIAVGETIVLTETDDIKIETTKIAETVFESTYRHKATGEVVLRRSDSEEKGTSLINFDPIFWNVLVNGKPTTEAQLQEIENARWAFKADHQSHTLSFKIANNLDKP